MDAHRYTTSPSKIAFTWVPRHRYWAKNSGQMPCDGCAVRKNPKGREERPPQEASKGVISTTACGGQPRPEPLMEPWIPRRVIQRLLYSASRAYTLEETPDPWSHLPAFQQEDRSDFCFCLIAFPTFSFVNLWKYNWFYNWAFRPGSW